MTTLTFSLIDEETNAADPVPFDGVRIVSLPCIEVVEVTHVYEKNAWRTGTRADDPKSGIPRYQVVTSASDRQHWRHSPRQVQGRNP